MNLSQLVDRISKSKYSSDWELLHWILFTNLSEYLDEINSLFLEKVLKNLMKLNFDR